MKSIRDLIEEIMKKNNQAIYDNVTPKSALVSNCLSDLGTQCQNIIDEANSNTGKVLKFITDKIDGRIRKYKTGREYYLKEDKNSVTAFRLQICINELDALKAELNDDLLDGEESRGAEMSKVEGGESEQSGRPLVPSVEVGNDEQTSNT